MLEYKDGKLYASYDTIKDLVKESGLRSKKKRHVMKRFKKYVNMAIVNYIKEGDYE